MKFSVGMFLVVTGVAFVAGTVLRLLYAAYLRSRSARDGRNVMQNLRFKDIGEELESSRSEEESAEEDFSDVEELKARRGTGTRNVRESQTNTVKT